MVKLKEIFKKLINQKSDLHELSSIYLKQVGANTVFKFLSILISLVYVPLVLGFLSQEKYGIWIALTAIINWIRLFDVGIGSGLRNKLARSIALKQYEIGRVYVSTTYGILGSIFILVLIVFFIVNPHLNWQGILNSVLISEFELTSVAAVAITFIVLGFILQPVVLVYDAHGNSAAGALIQLIISSVSLLLIWLATRYAEKGDIILLAWIVTGIPVLVYAATSFYTFLYKYPHLRPSVKLIRIGQSEDLLKLSVQFFVVQITSTIIYSSIPFIVTQLFSPIEVTLFSISNTIFTVPIMFMGLIASPILPLVTQGFARQEYNWLRTMLSRIKIVSFLLVAGTIIMIIISPLIYRIWLGNKVVIPFDLSVAIGIYTIISILGTPFTVFVNGIGKIRLFVILAPMGIAMFLGFSILFSKLLNNVIGVSIALSINNLVGLILSHYIVRKKLGEKQIINVRLPFFRINHN